METPSDDYLDKLYASAVGLTIEEANKLTPEQYDERLFANVTIQRNTFQDLYASEREECAHLAETLFTEHDKLSAKEAGKIIADIIRTARGSIISRIPALSC